MAYRGIDLFRFWLRKLSLLNRQAHSTPPSTLMGIVAITTLRIWRGALVGLLFGTTANSFGVIRIPSRSRLRM
jgi:hypothetical protein